MCEENLNPRLRARKSRIRQRLNRHHDGRKPFRITRRKTLEVVFELSILALCSAAAFLQSASSSIQQPHHALPAH
jgi:hypothetical protein